MRLSFTALYIASIVGVNYGFSVMPLVRLPDGTFWSSISLIVGFVFVTRDFAQREVGHGVLLAMLAGAGLSYVMADPMVAVASMAAFLISELVDWAVYSLTRRPLSDRILASSLFSTPVDSAVFLALIGQASIAGIATMTLSKMVGAILVWWLLRRRRAR